MRCNDERAQAVALIGKLIGQLLKRGSLTIISPDGSRATYGPGGGENITIRLHDRKVPFDIVRNPRLGFGEAFMDGRLTIEDGDILGLLTMVTGQNRWEDGGSGRKAMQRGQEGRSPRCGGAIRPGKARRNVAHHYDHRQRALRSLPRRRPPI